MDHYRMKIKHEHLNIFLEPATVTLEVDMYGKRQTCINALHQQLNHLKEQEANDGTEKFTMIEIVEIIEEE